MSHKPLFCLMFAVAFQIAAFAAPVIAAPDFWVVSGVPADDVLNIRKYPDPSAPQVGAVANGDRVRNLGCQRHGESEWCKIELLDEMGGEGWVNARYLRAASSSAETGSAIDHGGRIKNRCARAVAAKVGVSPNDVVVTRATISEGTGRHVISVGVPNSKADWVCEATRDGTVVNIFYGG